MTPSDRQRVFLALTLPPSIQERLAALARRLRADGASASWELTEKLHITLRFLGNIDLSALGRVMPLVEQTANRTSPLDIVFNTCGAFPSAERPRVLWVGAHPTEPLIRLMRDVESAARESGLEPEPRPPHPHCTIGRVKPSHTSENLTALIKSTTFDPILTRSSEVTLLKSVLHQGGSTYTTLHSYPFQRMRSTHD